MTKRRPHIAVFDLITSIGGVQFVLYGLLPRLKNGYDISVIDPYRNADYARRCTELGLNVVRLGTRPRTPYVGHKTHPTLRCLKLLGRSQWFLSVGLLLRRWLRKNNVDIVYFNQRSSTELFSRFVPKGVSQIYHCHGLTGPADVSSRLRKVLNTRIHATIAVSEKTKELLIEAGVPSDRIHVIYNGIDVERYCESASVVDGKLPARDPGEIVFVHPASIIHFKGQDVALEAFARIAPAVRSQLWFCGDVGSGGSKEYLQRIRDRVKELGLQNRVHFLGWRHDVAHVIASSDVCILPSQYESFGMVLAEAMALAKPCIGTNRGGVPEVIEDGVTGYIREPTASAFAEAMQALCDKPELRIRMGANGNTKCIDSFTTDRQAADLVRTLATHCRRSEPSPSEQSGEHHR
ncbi:MAG: glycosyltransferase family 4 protein [Pirellulales bacterium]|nr:glycosyltransferase family 4 protein [Pirellulales bacterium]